MKSVVYIWAYTLYCVCVITSMRRRIRATAAEEDACSRGAASSSRRSRGAAAEADTVVAQLGLTTRD